MGDDIISGGSATQPSRPGTEAGTMPGSHYDPGIVQPPPPDLPVPGAPGFMPYYAGPMPPGASYWAIASLACSLGGLFVLFPLGPVIGVIFGHIALVDIRKAQGTKTGRGMAITGLVVGYGAIGVAVLLIIGGIGLTAAAGWPRL